MFKNDKIILPLVFLFFTVQLFAQVPEEPPAVEEEPEMYFEIDDSKAFSPPAEIPKRVSRKKHRGRYGFYGYYNNVVVIPFIYDDLPKVFSDFMIAKKGKKFGVINKRNQEVVPFVYDGIYTLYDNWKTKKETGYFKIKREGFYGLLDKNGKVTIPAEYKDLDKWSKGVFLAGPKDGKYGLLDYDGNEVHPFTFEKKPVFAFDHHYVIQMDGKQGVRHVDGNIVIPLEYEYISSSLYKNYLTASKDGKRGLLDKTGKQVLPFEYNQIDEKRDGTFIVRKNDLKGVLDSNLQIMVPIIYDDIKMRTDRYFLVRKDRADGVVDLKGEEVLPCEYSKIHLAKGDIFVARKKVSREYFVINKNGDPIIEESFAGAKALKPLNFFKLQKEPNGKYGLFNVSLGKLVTNFEYDDFYVKRKKGSRSKEIEIRFKKNGLLGVLSETGEESNSESVTNSSSYQYGNRIEQTKTKIKKNIAGTWEGMIRVGEKNYWRELIFENGDRGERKIYYKDQGKLCVLTQQFVTVIIGEGSSRPFQVLVKINTHPVSSCGTLPEDLAKSIIQSQQEWLNIGRLSYDPLQIKEVDRKTEKGKMDLSKIEMKIRLRIIEGDLKAKLIPKPGGNKDAKFTINPMTLELSMVSFGRSYSIGKIQLEDKGYVLTTSKWETTGHYSLSGTLKNIKYIDPKGKVKTGDLDLCFTSKGKSDYWLKEFKE